MSSINFNKIIPGGNKAERNSGGGGGRIFKNRVIPESPKPERPPKQFNLFTRNDSHARAEKAANRLALQQQKEAAEILRQQKLAETRASIQAITTAGPAEPLDIPAIDRGLRPAIGRLAQRDPARALQVAEQYVAQVKAHNDGIFKMQEALEASRAAAEAKRLELDNKPIVAAGRSKSKPQHPPTPPRRILQGAVSVVAVPLSLLGRVITASLNGTPQQAFNNITVDGRGVHTFQPLSRISSRHITHAELPQHIIAVNPPSYLDKPFGFFSTLFGETTAQRLLPIGTIGVTDRQGNIVVGEAPAIFPVRKKAIMEAALRASAIPIMKIPAFEPEPDLAALLGPAAKELGIEKQENTPAPRITPPQHKGAGSRGHY
ncbi:hypothetical protein A3D03_01795 [Candidatus Gottesmanbacteria bacterium RIFCSPHIGHO2_02_FULL_40_13]|uniref:Uncharacterized protein n=1 Tax=Candidatus Gottesmanbacteria bacterium RIFCSPHIGHO2_02_FULL_40_13 TaxID=1798384 RepID=A0A1F6A7Z9_9BACT|nr:MAG: hypothetical protein A3D03_01795 [Candidatus Gottesmanbacteria bacterium RIFCSPHIGHO2_02_FULL_40_13]